MSDKTPHQMVIESLKKSYESTKSYINAKRIDVMKWEGVPFDPEAWDKSCIQCKHCKCRDCIAGTDRPLWFWDGRKWCKDCKDEWFAQCEEEEKMLESKDEHK